MRYVEFTFGFNADDPTIGVRRNRITFAGVEHVTLQTPEKVAVLEHAPSPSQTNAPGSGGGYPRHVLAVLPVTRWELPGWGSAVRRFRIGAESNPFWTSAPLKLVRGKRHGYLMELNLADWSERLTFFLGRYHELAVLLVLEAALSPGDRMVDIGANIGMLTLHAAARVGATGVVESFEPNPVCCSRIEQALHRNGIRHVVLHRTALSDEPGTLKLRVLGHHLGEATLAEVPDEYVTSSAQVPVSIGDGILSKSDRPIRLIKIDVEGFETRALRGLRETIARWQPIIVTEVVPAWLERAGSSVAELRELMQSMGYAGYAISTERQWLRHALRLAPLAEGDIPSHVSDVVWLPKQSLPSGRLSKFVVS